MTPFGDATTPIVALTGMFALTRTDVATSSAAASSVREDGSIAQTVSVDAATGSLVRHYTQKGLSNDSTWSRGQAWAMLAFAQATRWISPKFIPVAVQVADWWIEHLPLGCQNSGRPIDRLCARGRPAAASNPALAKMPSPATTGDVVATAVARPSHDSSCRDPGRIRHARYTPRRRCLSRTGSSLCTTHPHARLLAPDRAVVSSAPCNASHVSAKAATPRSRQVRLINARLGTAIGPGRMAVMCTDGTDSTGRS